MVFELFVWLQCPLLHSKWHFMNCLTRVFAGLISDALTCLKSSERCLMASELSESDFSDPIRSSMNY